MANFAGLERAMERYLERDWLGGYSVYLSHAEEPPYVRYAGYADRDVGIPIRENTLFRIMSMAKPMTAAAAMALVERGKLRLDHPVRKYVPCTQWVYDGNGGKMPLPADRDLTVMHLLNHTNGLGMSDAHMEEIFRATQGRNEGLAMWAEAAAAVPLEFMPGTRTGYSSYVGFTLLGHVLEAAAGMPFRDVLRIYLHEPLGMEPPMFHLKKDEMPRLSRVYETTEEGLAAMPLNYFPSPYPEDVPLDSGAGGVFMTLGDGARFAGMLAGEGMWNGVRVLKPETVRAMTTNTLAPGLFPEPGVRWGIGLALYGDTEAYPYAPGSFGWGGYYGNKFWVDPARRLFAVYMFNVVGGQKDEMRRIIEREVYAGLDA